ncbi:MAG: SCO6745 family protein [Ilumatobacteraceae bacterium]
MARDASTARAVWQRLEPIHAVTYFAPEAIGALGAAGYKGFWMGYFAGRAAPLGPVGPEVVTAIFNNFAPGRVARALPDAWHLAGPDVALQARLDGSVDALRRALDDDDGVGGGGEVETAAELAGRAVRSAPVEGRPLFAANAALPWPDEPVAALWHAATLLREHRGDGHVACLTAAGLSGRESNVFQAAAGNTPRQVLAAARDYDEAEWQALVAALAERGVLTADGDLTAAGRDLKRDLEQRTDEIALPAYAALSDAELDQLIAALTPLARAVVAAGDMPKVTPMGLTLDD